MSISELANTPIEITLGGKKLKIQRLSINELFTPAETKVQEQYIANVHKMAAKLEGKEKIDFIDRKFDQMPIGSVLDKMALDYMQTPNGISQILMLGLNKCQKMEEEEVANLIVNSTPQELEFIRDYLSGDQDKKKPIAEVEKTEKAEESVQKPA